MAFTVTPETAGILEGEGYTTKTFDAGYQYFMVVNSKENETLSDLKLRQAINVAINREDMVTALRAAVLQTPLSLHNYQCCLSSLL